MPKVFLPGGLAGGFRLLGQDRSEQLVILGLSSTRWSRIV